MKYPIGIQTFADIREGGYVYVDKTKLIYDLVDQGKYYFLSRPRRFGKSLLVSTLEAYFEGRRDLFEGLAIDSLETKWEQYPVFHLDLSNETYNHPEVLRNRLIADVAAWGSQYGATSTSDSPSLRFEEALRRAYEQTGRRVVVLVDEYDAPVVNVIDEPELFETNRANLIAFFQTLKAYDRYIEFAFLTAVTKFGQNSPFSSFNNLRNISFSNDYEAICGYTEQELHDYFDEEVAALASENGMAKEECYQRLHEMFGGYHFSRKFKEVYNPSAILNALKQKDFFNEWFFKGTPAALRLALKGTDDDITELPGAYTKVDHLVNVDSYTENLLPLFYQSGYLTLKEETRTGFIILDFPNDSVRDSFNNYLIPYCASVAKKKE